jgi:signal transduction histidine kinase
MSDQSRPMSAVIHELKNPILAIERLAKLVLEKETLSDNARRKLKLIHGSAREASGYLQELDLSSAPVVPDSFSSDPVDLGLLGRWVTERFQTHAEYKNQQLQFAATDDPCVVMGDAVRLREAMNNLISNALKYSPKGGTVSVEVTRTEDTVRFSVADNGPGLSEQDQKRLFRPFERLGPTPTGDEESSGLGLYIVKEIMDRHNGAVTVDSTREVGSTFTLALSAASPSALAGDKSPRPSRALPSQSDRGALNKD